jgi:hypothetical protein
VALGTRLHELVGMLWPSLELAMITEDSTHAMLEFATWNLLVHAAPKPGQLMLTLAFQLPVRGSQSTSTQESQQVSLTTWWELSYTLQVDGLSSPLGRQLEDNESSRQTADASLSAVWELCCKHHSGTQ